MIRRFFYAHPVPPRWIFIHRALLSCTAGILLLLLFSACAQSTATPALIQITLTADGQIVPIELPAGSTVVQALEQAKLTLDELDRTEPPVYTVLGEGASVRVVRVREEFEIEEVPIPFEQQTMRNESLPVDVEALIQHGRNGMQEITYRRVYEDGVEVTSKPVPVKAVIVQEPQPEIRMIGVQTPFAPIELPGLLYYLRDGNVWKIEGSSANRLAALAAGNLDGRALSLSDDGDWLLFTRLTEEEGQINELWAADISGKGEIEPGTGQPAQPMASLGVKNIIHFADFVPNTNNKVLFSTVEPRQAAPGWQANNDLQQLTFSPNGWTTQWTEVLEPNAGGVYGWWGANFIWGVDSRYLAYARADSVGIVDYRTGVMTPTLNLLPLQTGRDWAWVPGLAWGPDGKTLYTMDHIAPEGALNPEESRIFDLTAILLDGGSTLHMVSQTGMFAYPLASPMQEQPDGLDYQIAFLQAIFPDQSETSRYRLYVMDRDGSDRRAIFPPDPNSGMEPQQHWGAWSPAPLASGVLGSRGADYALAVIYQGNLWIVNAANGERAQITGDGLTTRLLWR